MKSNFPLKKLLKHNFWFAIITATFVSFFSKSVGGEDIKIALIYFVSTFIIIALTGLVNFGVLILLEKKINVRSSNFWIIQRTINFVILSFLYCVGILCYFSIRHIDLSLYNISIPLFLSMFANGFILTQQYNIILEYEKSRADLENSNLMTANAEAANKLLQQQIHPHFLFNALNTLKSLYRKDPKVGEEYLICLSDFLRVSVSKHNASLTILKNEVKLCMDYLGMQKMRFGEALNFSVAISDDKLENGYVPFFSIQPLLENAIKHNELTEESPLHISVEQSGDWVTVTNNIQLKTSSEISSGYGLANLSERYRVLSNDEVIIENNKKTFSVSLKILKNENSNNRR